MGHQTSLPIYTRRNDLDSFLNSEYHLPIAVQQYATIGARDTCTTLKKPAKG